VHVILVFGIVRGKPCFVQQSWNSAVIRRKVLTVKTFTSIALQLSCAFILFAVARPAHAQLEVQASVPRSQYAVGKDISVLVIVKNTSSAVIHVPRIIAAEPCPVLSLYIESVSHGNRLPNKGKCFVDWMSDEEFDEKELLEAKSRWIALEPGYVYGTTIKVNSLPVTPTRVKITAIYRLQTPEQLLEKLRPVGINYVLGSFQSRPIEVNIIQPKARR
jgi:hypothetical protein